MEAAMASPAGHPKLYASCQPSWNPSSPRGLEIPESWSLTVLRGAQALGPSLDFKIWGLGVVSSQACHLWDP